MLQPVTQKQQMMQQVGAEGLDPVVARSLVVDQPGDENNLCRNNSSMGKGGVVLPMSISGETMARTTKYQECLMMT